MLPSTARRTRLSLAAEAAAEAPLAVGLEEAFGAKAPAEAAAAAAAAAVVEPAVVLAEPNDGRGSRSLKALRTATSASTSSRTTSREAAATATDKCSTNGTHAGWVVSIVSKPDPEPEPEPRAFF